MPPTPILERLVGKNAKYYMTALKAGTSATHGWNQAKARAAVQEMKDRLKEQAAMAREMAREEKEEAHRLKVEEKEREDFLFPEVELVRANNYVKTAGKELKTAMESGNVEEIRKAEGKVRKASDRMRAATDAVAAKRQRNQGRQVVQARQVVQRRPVQQQWHPAQAGQQGQWEEF